VSKSHFALFLAFVADFRLTGYAEPNKGQYELQERYGCAAKEYFAGEFGTKYTKNDQTTIIYNFRNHYNAKMNKCLVLIMTRYLIKKSPRSEPSLIWLSILDINETREFGAFGQTSSEASSSTCEVDGAVCHSRSQWELLIAPYMSEVEGG
jgi:hypothetical protein